MVGTQGTTVAVALTLLLDNCYLSHNPSVVCVPFPFQKNFYNSTSSNSMFVIVLAGDALVCSQMIAEIENGTAERLQIKQA